VLTRDASRAVDEGVRDGVDQRTEFVKFNLATAVGVEFANQSEWSGCGYRWGDLYEDVQDFMGFLECR
jgi:hypothetical protein